MTMDLCKSLVEAITERPDAARPPAPEPGANPVRNPHEQRPVDWDHAVHAAAARLEEAWIQPDLTGYMRASGLADEFAATLCAYGMVAAEVDHMVRRFADRPSAPR